jgi:hypothetical protein
MVSGSVAPNEVELSTASALAGMKQIAAATSSAQAVSIEA